MYKIHKVYFLLHSTVSSKNSLKFILLGIDFLKRCEWISHTGSVYLFFYLFHMRLRVSVCEREIK